MSRKWKAAWLEGPLPPPPPDDTPQRIAVLRDELERLEEIHRDALWYVPQRRAWIERRIGELAAARGEQT